MRESVQVQVLFDAAPQPQDSLGVELGDPGLGHAQHLADLLQGETLVVVEADDDALPLGQPLDARRPESP